VVVGVGPESGSIAVDQFCLRLSRLSSAGPDARRRSGSNVLGGESSSCPEGSAIGGAIIDAMRAIEVANPDLKDVLGGSGSVYAQMA